MSGFRRQFSFRDAVAAIVVVTLLALCPYTPAPAVDIKCLVVYLAAPILLFACGRSRAANVFRPEYWSPITLLWLAFVTLNLVATAFSTYPGHSLESSSWLVALFLLHLAATQAFHRPCHIDRLLYALVIGALATTVYGMVQHCGLDPFPWALNEDTAPLYARMPASFGNPNLAGHVLVLSIVACAYLVIARRSVAALAGLLCLAAHLVATGHRGGLLGAGSAACVALLAALVTWLIRPDTSGSHAAPRTARRRLVVLLLSSGIVSAAVASILVANRAWASDPSAILRANAAYGAARMILETPVLGRGSGNYEIESPRYWTRVEQEEYGQRRHYNRHVHNEILQASVDAGIGAGAVYAALLLTAICSALYLGFSTALPRRRRIAFAFAALFSAFVVDGCFGFNLRAPASGTVLAVLTGAFDGVFLRRAGSASPVSRGTARWALHALLLTAVANASLGACSFAAQYCRQTVRNLAGAGTLDQAARYAALSQRLSPRDWCCAHDAGVVAMASGDYAAAMRNFRRALALNPNHIPTIVAAARACRDIAVLIPSADAAREDSRRYTLRALTLCPFLPEAYENLGLLSLLRGNGSAVRGLGQKAGTEGSASPAAEDSRPPNGRVSCPGYRPQADSQHKTNFGTSFDPDALNMAEEYFLRALACGIQDPSRVYSCLAEIAQRHGDASEARAYAARARISSAEQMARATATARSRQHATGQSAFDTPLPLP